jgi:TonB-linked SusC/RagA family outer membrane protein
MLLGQSAFAQRTITGTVVDHATGETLPFVTVVVKGTGTGVVTSESGQFSISVPSAEGVLVFSFMGYETQEVAVTSASSITVRLRPSATALEGVVVTGMFTRQANTYTGAVNTITREELLRSGNQNVLASLSALDPSMVRLMDLSMGSNPNATPNFQMRGQSALPNMRGDSALNPNQPLFILDGFETSITKIIDLDMNLVESINILKDATAKAMYGAKAANGVIVIETRRPSKGRMRINYNGTLNFEIPDLNSYNVLDARDKIEAERLAGFYTNERVDQQRILDEIYDGRMKDILSGVNTYWLSQPLRVGVGNRHSFYLEGGDDYMLYGVDLSNNRINGVMKGSDRNTFSGGLSLTYRVNKFQFRNRLTISDNIANNSPYGSFSSYAHMNPYRRIHDTLGDLIKTYSVPSVLGSGTETNPIWNASINTKNFSEYTDITNNFFAEYNPIQNLRFTARFGYTKQLSSADDFKPASHTDFVGFIDEDLIRRGRYTKNQGRMTNLDGDLGASYSFTVGKHLLFSNVMWTISDYSFNSYNVTAEGFPNEFMDDISFAVQYLKEGTPEGFESVQRTVGGVGSINYSFDDRYLFDANYRLSGSSAFGVNSRWGSFWSVGAGWNMHEEVFMKSLRFINQLRLRASTGYTGSQGFSTFDAIATFRYFGTSPYRMVWNGVRVDASGSWSISESYAHIGSYLMALANQNLSWQKRYDQNYGIDFALFDKKLSGRFEYYTSRTDGLLTSVTAPPSMGFTTYRENLGEVENKGVEAQLNYRVWSNPRKGSYVNVYASVAHNKNTLTKISDALRSWNESVDRKLGEEDPEYPTEPKERDAYWEKVRGINTPSVRFVEGQSMDAIWAVRSKGIDPVTGKEIYVKRNGERTFEWSAADQVVVGDAMPKINGIVGFNIEMYNFTLNVIADYRWGGQRYNQTLVNRVENANIRQNVDRRVFTDRWQQEGDISRFKGITEESLTRPSSRFVEDDNTFTLRTINLTYDFRDFKFVQNSFIERLRFSVFLNDIFTLSSIKIERGINYPFARTVSFALQASF